MFVERITTDTLHTPAYPTDMGLLLGSLTVQKEVRIGLPLFRLERDTNPLQDYYDANPVPGLLNHLHMCIWLDAGRIHE
jgi:hypothetical protein